MFSKLRKLLPQPCSDIISLFLIPLGEYTDEEIDSLPFWYRKELVESGKSDKNSPLHKDYTYGEIVEYCNYFKVEDFKALNFIIQNNISLREKYIITCIKYNATQLIKIFGKKYYFVFDVEYLQDNECRKYVLLLNDFHSHIRFHINKTELFQKYPKEILIEGASDILVNIKGDENDVTIFENLLNIGLKITPSLVYVVNQRCGYFSLKYFLIMEKHKYDFNQKENGMTLLDYYLKYLISEKENIEFLTERTK